MTVDVCIPSLGRASLARLLGSLAPERGVLGRVVVVDDRRDPAGALAVPDGVEVVPGRRLGPAAARNDGWRALGSEWIAFLDDDVLVPPGWSRALLADLAAAADDVAGVQGRIRVPLPPQRRPTDWERNVAGLEGARWATADMAFRRTALEGVGGFDERFRRAYREDSDLALRLLAAGWRLERGERTVVHPVPPASRLVSVRLQAGNADDVRMRRLHGRGWRRRAGAPAGRFRRHVAVTAAAALAVAAAVRGRRLVAVAAGAAWTAGTLELACARIAPGPRTPAEVATMLGTSAAIPPAAVVHAITGAVRAAGEPPDETEDAEDGWTTRPLAVLFDRDGTLVEDVPYNGDPARVRPVTGARAALERLRAADVRTAVVTNQSGVARGVLTETQVAAVNARVDQLLGPLGPWLVCPHGPADGCMCRKPAAGLVLAAARALGVEPSACAVVGDTGSDVAAALAAGARAVLVPNGVTRPEEVRSAPEVARDLEAAVDLLLGGAP